MKDKTLKLAREARLVEYGDGLWFACGGLSVVKAFEALVRADEREACAKTIEETAQWRGGKWISTLSPETKSAIAAAIRARGETK